MTYVDSPFKSPSIISYCTGMRGLERGLERAIGTIRTVAYVEIEAFIIENLLAGMESGLLVPAPIWANLKNFDARPFCNRVHGIIGGYPCQPFSNAGNRKGTADPRHLWPYLERDIKAVDPIWCYFENVSGHLSLGFDEVYRSLSDMGYSVEAGIFTAEEVGAPHQRERLFILAINRDFLANSESAGEWRRTGNIFEENGRQVSELLFKPGSAGQELADSNSVRHIHRQFTEQPAERGKHAQRDVAANGDPVGISVADSSISGLQERWHAQPNKQSPAKRSCQLWPARPGQQQYPWEKPRTTKPGVGCSINGYNYREDLLRAYGNGVVEQTAEVAFVELFNKHFDK